MKSRTFKNFKDSCERLRAHSQKYSKILRTFKNTLILGVSPTHWKDHIECFQSQSKSEYGPSQVMEKLVQEFLTLRSFILVTYER